MTSEMTTRERILREASILFARQGYHNTSTRQIAAAVGVRQPSLFYHFATKTEIMRTLLAVAIDESVEWAEAELAAEGSPARRLHRYIVADLVTICRSPYDLAGTTTQPVMRDPEFSEAAEHYARLLAARTELIQEGIDAGEFLPVRAALASRAIEWTIEGLSTEIGAETPEDLESVATEVADFCVRALLIDGSILGELRAPD